MNQCRTCRSNHMEPVLELGNQPPAQRFLTEDDLDAPEPMAPLDVYVCLDCALIQVADNVPPGFFDNYLYVSSMAEAGVRHFESFARTVVERFATGGNNRVADIGSCDGVFLDAARQAGAKPLGIEPAANLAAIARDKGLEVINKYFTPEVAETARQSYGRMAAISMSNTFNIIDDLDSVVIGIKLLLDDAGVFVIEVPQATDLVQNNEFDTIYHEHLSQFSVHSMVALFERHNMDVFDLERIPLHGGSMRIFVQHRQTARPISESVAAALEREQAARLFDKATYSDFRDRVQSNRVDFRALLDQIKGDGGRVAAYGAAAKGTTLLNYYGLGPDRIDFIADRNGMKHGMFSPGQHIPVAPPDRILSAQPDYLVILAWNFADEIIEQQGEYRCRGGKFILPIPETRVID